MQYRNLGQAGVKVSALCLGGWNLGSSPDEKGSIELVHRALDLGINFLDNSDRYGVTLSGIVGLSETVLGKALQSGKRDQVVLATKCRGKVGPGPNDEGLSRYHIVRACEASLKRLQTDYLDLYYAHFPDPYTPLEETLEAFDLLVRQGKLLYLGLSNYSAWEVCKSLRISDMRNLARIVCAQNEYSLIRREPERELLPLCGSEGLGMVCYSPLGAGFLTGKYRPDQPWPETVRLKPDEAQALMTERNLAVLGRVEQIAKARAVSLSQVALAWLLAQPAVSSVVSGVRSAQQLEQNLAALDLTLSPEELASLSAS